jgi:hypothetical protein
MKPARRLLALILVLAVLGSISFADPMPDGGGLKPKPCATCRGVAPTDPTPVTTP